MDRDSLDQYLEKNKSKFNFFIQFFYLDFINIYKSVIEMFYLDFSPADYSHDECLMEAINIKDLIYYKNSFLQ